MLHSDRASFGDPKTYYEKFYNRMPTGETSKKSLINFIIHFFVEPKLRFDQMRLEIGAGKGEHLEYLGAKRINSFDKYIATDFNYNSIKDAPILSPKQLNVVCNGLELPFKDNYFDEVVSTCVVAHVVDVEKIMSEMLRVCKVGGHISFLIPCEPSLILFCVRKLILEPKANSIGFFGYNLYISRDHPFHARGLITRSKHVYRKQLVKFKYVPFFFPLVWLNLNICVKIKKISS